MQRGRQFIRRLCIIVMMVLGGTGVLMAQDAGLYNLPDPFTVPVYRSSTIAITRAGRVLVANPLADTVTLLGLDGTVEATFDIGQNPHSVAITPDNLRAVALSEAELVVITLETNTISQRIAITGGYRMVTDGDRVFVARRAAGEIAVVSLTGDVMQIEQRIPTPPAPAGLALWGNFLYVTHSNTGDLSLIFLPVGAVVRTVQLDSDASHAVSIEVNPRTGTAYIPQSLSNTAAPVPDNRIIPVVQVVDLRTLQRVDTINLIAADRYVQRPADARLNQTRTQLYIANAGSGDVSVISLDDLIAVAHFEVDTGADGLLFNGNYTSVFTHNKITGTVMRHDTRFFSQEDVISSGRIAPEIEVGARLFYTQGCVACHAGGEPDGRTWYGEATPPLDDMTTDKTAAALAHHQRQFGIVPPAADSIERAALIVYLQALDND